MRENKSKYLIDCLLSSTSCFMRSFKYISLRAWLGIFFNDLLPTIRLCFHVFCSDRGKLSIIAMRVKSNEHGVPERQYLCRWANRARAVVWQPLNVRTRAVQVFLDDEFPCRRRRGKRSRKPESCQNECRCGIAKGIPPEEESVKAESNSKDVDTSTTATSVDVTKGASASAPTDDDCGDLGAAPSPSPAVDAALPSTADTSTSDGVSKDTSASTPTDDDWGDFDAAPLPSLAVGAPPSSSVDKSTSDGVSRDASASAPADDDWGDFDAAPAPVTDGTSMPPADTTPSPDADASATSAAGGGWVDDDDGEWGSFEETPTPSGNGRGTLPVCVDSYREIVFLMCFICLWWDRLLRTTPC